MGPTLTPGVPNKGNQKHKGGGGWGGGKQHCSQRQELARRNSKDSLKAH